MHHRQSEPLRTPCPQGCGHEQITIAEEPVAGPGRQRTCPAGGSSSCRSSGSCSRPAHPRRRPHRRRPHRSPGVTVRRRRRLGWSGAWWASAARRARRCGTGPDDSRRSDPSVARSSRMATEVLGDPDGRHLRFTATSPSYDGGQGECSARGAVQLRSHRHPCTCRLPAEVEAPRRQARFRSLPLAPAGFVVGPRSLRPLRRPPDFVGAERPHSGFTILLSSKCIGSV